MIPPNRLYRVVRLIVVISLIFSQLVLPIGQLGLQMVFTHTKEPQETVIQEDKGAQVVATKQELESGNSSLKVALKRESGFEQDATLDASLDTESKEDNN